MISKFPPIQGGISAQTFWMAKGLAEKGAAVHVVTNANSVEPEYYINDQISELPQNLIVHHINSDIPWHIPCSPLYVPGLLDKAMEIVGDNHIDLIDTNYLIPYGIVGYLLSSLTGIPYVLRHGGSDIEKFLKQGVFSHLLTEVIRNAAVIITDDRHENIFKSMNPRTLKLPRYIPDSKYFKPAMNVHETPAFAYFGKINYYWRYKSLDKIVEIFSGIKSRYALKIIGQGKGFAEFAKFVDEHCLNILEHNNFVHPAHVPSLLGNIDYLLYFEKDNPIKDFSNIVCEALWSGLTLITDRTMDVNEYARFTRGIPENQIVRVDLDDIETTQKEIGGLINKWSAPSRCSLEIEYGYDRYLNDTLKVYESM